MDGRTTGRLAGGRAYRPSLAHKGAAGTYNTRAVTKKKEVSLQVSAMITFKQQLILTAIDKLVFAIIVAVAVYYLNRTLEKYKGEQALRREYEALRDQAALTHLQRQIEELYSPLLGLIQQARIIRKVASLKCPGGRSGPRPDVWEYFVDKHFLKLDRQISDLLRAKVHLLETDEMPESYQQFLAHATEYDSLLTLWKDRKIPSDDIPVTPWPSTFESDVKGSLDKLRRSYNEDLRRLNAGV